MPAAAAANAASAGDCLPAELRALAAFLEVDDRPTVIFEQVLAGEVFENEAFRSIGVGVEEAKRALNEDGVEYRGAARSEGDGRQLSWNRRHLGNGFVAITLVSSPAKFELDVVNHQSTQPAKSGISANNHTEHVENLDWLRHPHDGLLPWQQFIHQHDWARTPLGALEEWPYELRSVVLAAMADPAPRTIYWGPQNALIYNEAFVPIFGVNHPDCLGQPLEIAWRPGMREIIWPYIESAYNGSTQKINRLALHLERNGFLEETYWDATLTPAIGPEGTAVGVQNVLTECTRAVRMERRRIATVNVGKRITAAATLEELWASFLGGLQCEVVDLPYAAFYAAEHDLSELVSESTDSNAYTPERTICTLESTMGVTQPSALPQAFTLADETLSDSTKALAKAFTSAWKGQRHVVLSSEEGTLPSEFAFANPDRGFGDPVKQSVAIPITSITSRDLMGVLLVGLCPRVPFDEGYDMWLTILGDILLKAAAFISLPLEQRRAQKMSDDVNNALAQQLRLTTLQAERSDAKFSRMAKLAPIGMYVLDPEGNPLYVNDAYRRVAPDLPDGRTIAFKKPSDWTDCIHPEDVGRFWESWNKVTVEKIPDICEYRILKEWRSIDKATGEELHGDTWLLATSFPEIEPDGRVSVIMGWLTDISHQKAAEKLLSQKLEDALETKRQSENFIDMTSHEMRNPLSAILQSADSIVSSLQLGDNNTRNQDTVLAGHLVEDLVDAAHTIILCAQHQKRIVDDILTLSKLDASLLEIAPDKVQPPQLVEKALRMYEAEISRAGIKTRLVVEPTYDELGVDWVVLDPSRLLQVVINLLTNAIKFTQYADIREIAVYIGASYVRPTGKHHGINFIPLRHTKAAHTPKSEWGDGEDIYLQVAVTDTGSGLNEEQMQVLFQRFAQASPKTYKQYGGSGLGLFISRELCELQGGQIGVASGEGKTTFTFYVKAKRWVERTLDAGVGAPLARFVSASSSPMVFSRRGSSVIGHTQEMSAAAKQAPELDGAADNARNSILKPSSGLLPVDPDTFKHLHVLIVEGKRATYHGGNEAPLTMA